MTKTAQINQKNLNEAMKKEGLLYDVKTYKETNPFTGEELPYFGTYRDDTKHIFKTGLTEKYNTIQNREAAKVLIDFANVADQEVQLKRIGDWNNGQEVFMTMKIDGDQKIGGARSKDTVEQNVSLYLRHDGHSSCKFVISNFRLFCMNQLRALFMKASFDKILRIRHTKTAQDRLAQLSAQWQIINGVFKQTHELYNTMADTKVKQKQVEDVFEALHPTNSKSASINTMNSKTQEILAGIFADADGGKVPTDTAWNLYNTITNYNTHQNDLYKNHERSLLVGTGARNNQEAIKVVQEYTDIAPALIQFDVNRLMSKVDVKKTENLSEVDKLMSLVDAE